MDSAKLLKDIGIRLSKVRKDAGYTQERLAEEIDVTPQTISYAEQGKKAMRAENIIKICTALDISADYLLMGKDIMALPGITDRIFQNLTQEQKIYIKLILDSCINLCKTK